MLCGLEEEKGDQFHFLRCVDTAVYDRHMRHADRTRRRDLAALLVLLAQVFEHLLRVGTAANRIVGRLAIGRKAGDAFGMIDFADMEVTPLTAFQKARSFQF